MADFWGSLISGGASILGGLFQNDSLQKNSEDQFLRNWFLQKDSQSYNSAEAAMDRYWRTQMANTAYQRQSADMKAAGINPILMTGQGPVSTPSGGSASAGQNSVSMADAKDFITPAVSNALQALNLTAAIEQMAAQTDKTRAEIGLVGSQIKTQDAMSAEALSRIPGHNEAAAVARAQAENLRSSAQKYSVDAQRGSQEYGLINKTGAGSGSVPAIAHTLGGRVASGDTVEGARRIVNVIRDKIDSYTSPTADTRQTPHSAKGESDAIERENRRYSHGRMGRLIPPSSW